MKTILVPVDFSPVAENAATYAANLAEFYGADLWLFHTYEMVFPLTEYSYPFVSEAEMQHAANFELEEFGKRLQAKLRRHINIMIRAENNTLLEGLKGICEEIKPDLVVMGLSGKNALTRLIIGSNTIRVIQQLAYPVLVVPPKAVFIPVRKIGFACDYKHVIKTTPLEPMKKLVHGFGAELHVLNIDFHHRNTTADTMKENIFIRELLNEFRPDYHSISTEDTNTGINWFAEKEKLDMVVVIPKKHNLLEKLFGRIQEKDLLYHTHLPVLCIHE